jgi:Lysyl oxidase
MEPSAGAADTSGVRCSWPSLLALASAALLFGASCGGDEVDYRAFVDPEPPVGKAVLPDLVPDPPDNLATKLVDGRWRVSFSTVIVNVGEGDLLLRATREDDGDWHAEQLVAHSVSGAAPVPLDVSLAWGGDGHDHWHVKRVARVWLTSRDAIGRRADGKSRSDTKIGFCFYDHTHQLRRGPSEAVFSSHTCGHEQDTLVGMGLSPGWNDVYARNLPGQFVDLAGVRDGKYRIWAEVDEARRFREARRDNNVTWADFDLTTRQGGVRIATVSGTGPRPS